MHLSKRTDISFMKEIRFENIEDWREGYKQLLALGWEKPLYLIAISSDTWRHQTARLCKI